MKVPLLDLKAQYSTIKKEMEKKLLEIAESQYLILGPEVEKIEETLAEYLGVKYALAVSSGTDSLLMAMMAIDIQPGDEVIMPTFSFFATAGTAARLGAVPVFVDSDPVSFNIDPSKIEEKITNKTKAIVPVHLYGQAADMDTINEIACKHEIFVIEDSAQAIGAQYKNGKYCGSMGYLSGFSFYPTKNLGGFGEGGLATTNDEKIYTKLKQMRNHGMEPKYHHKFIGGNFRMDALQAAALNVKFPHLDNWHSKRRANAHKLNELFIEKGLAEETGRTEFDTNNQILLPKEIYADFDLINPHIYHQYVIRSFRRDELKQYLWDNGIGSEIYYPIPFHRQECFEYLNYQDIEFPVANKLADEVLALPVYPEMSQEQIHLVADTIEEFIKN